MTPSLAPFSAPYAEDDVAVARALFLGAALAPEREARIDTLATQLIKAIRDTAGGLGGVEELLREYSLSTKEGLALMVLAEALLRVPDAATADRLIVDKLSDGDFAHHEPRSDALLVAASAWALGVTARIIEPRETPEGILGQLTRRIGAPAVRAATRQAMRVLGNHFVLGQTIEEALERARSGQDHLYRYSFDMLGEGARTGADAEHHFASYADAIEAIGRAADNEPLPDRPGISVKLSALHPRYEAVSRVRVLRELVPRVVALATRAKSYDLNFTVDAEEADRLELSLEVIAAVSAEPALGEWEGFGLAVQTYQKRALAVIDWIAALSKAHGRRMMVRLVKGAYWDTEIKRAQERGLADYPVFTRKAMTDLNYVACVNRLLALRPRLFPQFATHNALTIAAIVGRAGASPDYEFQRLHGMGEAVYGALLERVPGTACRIYAPVGGHRDLLAYLVRRLLENGANSSFVSVAADPDIPAAELLRRPAAIIGAPEAARHRRVPLPRDIYAPRRRNSNGVELGHRASLDGLLTEIAAARPPSGRACGAPFSLPPTGEGGERRSREPGEGSGRRRPVISPIDGRTVVAHVVEDTPRGADRAMAAAAAGFRAWAKTPATERATILERASDLLEERRGHYLALLQLEGGKTLDDALAELREAVDFYRYYAAETRRLFGDGEIMPGPTGEDNRLTLRGRGVFVAISPWNFPLAIFTGQVAAALAAGNAVVAKPAEQTPLIAAEMVRLLHEAGVPSSALHLVLGDGAIGARLIDHRAVSGVVFTGSTEVARLINRALAGKTGPIVPLIAETGGINAMIVDATALPEQVTDDVITSAFRSAGQRCSALRLLCVQEDVADHVIGMIAGAARELAVADPRLPSTHVGPIIDEAAKARLDGYVSAMGRAGRLIYAGAAPAEGAYVAPHIVELATASQLKEEVFGPVLHVVRYRASDLDRLIEEIAATGYGLTFGVHSRINETVERIVRRLLVGNVYVNRNMIGAVVGTQPFGGHGLSGTGPKAGGPHYLARFAAEQTVTVNTAAAGGNASLIAIEE